MGISLKPVDSNTMYQYITLKMVCTQQTFTKTLGNTGMDVVHASLIIPPCEYAL